MNPRSRSSVSLLVSGLALALMASATTGCTEVADNIVSESTGFTADVSTSGIDGNAFFKDGGVVPGVGQGDAETPGPGACIPDCFGKACGDDGCGGECGECTDGLFCSASGFCTNEPCQGSCLGLQCGDDGCGQSCGSCGGGEQCTPQGQCIPEGCTQDCFGKACGDDGCGGQCGKCAPDETCNANAQCAPVVAGCGGIPESGVCEANTVKWCFNNNIYTLNCDPAVGLVCGWNDTQQKFDCVPGDCQPSCLGKQCGPDGCGASCGICPGGESCTPAGVCQANCVGQCNGKQCGPNGCGGTCGTCGPGQVCGGDGACKAGNCVANCVGKQCGPDGCGGKCGICPGGQSCQANGTCIAGGCTPDCTGKQCGLDGCGGSCGNCPAGLNCGVGFKCQEGPCQATCQGKQCGPDGCGASCGICPGGQSCSFQGVCQDGGCAPSCAGKQCGADGCGGSCGVCPGIMQCNGDGLCQDPNGCTPSCNGKDCGPDGCGGTCGICVAGLSCSGQGLCEANGSGGDCGDITFEGVCEGTILKYCSGESLTVIDCVDNQQACGWQEGNGWFDCVDAGECTPDCTGKVCGDDGCGGSCGGCAEGEACTGAGQCLAEGGGCGDITFVGQCDGNTLQYCSNNELTFVDCTEQAKFCGFDEVQEWFDCLDEPTGCVPACDGVAAGGPDGCGGLCSGAGGGCGDIDQSGICDGSVLKYCANESLVEVDCAASQQTCGFDQEFGWFDCVEGGGCVADCAGKAEGADDGCGGQCPATGGCGDVDQAGACDGTTLHYCAGGELQSVDCAAQGLACGFVAEQDWFDCIDGPVDPPTGCGDLDQTGKCDGTLLQYCSGETITEVQCADQGKTCGFEETFGWFDCIDGDTPCVADCANKNPGDPDLCGGVCPNGGDGCGDVDTQGHCEGNLLEYCASGQLQSVDCVEFDKVCGYDETFDWFDCIDVDTPCVPDCLNKNEGDPDGCGGVCDGQPPVDGCGDVDQAGGCEGDVLTYCANDALISVDCTEQSKTCGFDAQFDWFDCLDGDPGCVPDCVDNPGQPDGCGGTCPGEPPVGGCGDIDQAGACDGNTLTYCAGDQIQTFDCTQFSKICAFDETFDWFDCVDDPGGCTPNCAGLEAGADDGCGGTCSGEPPVDGCGDLGSDGECQGDVLSYCSGGEVVTVDCAAQAKICDFETEFDWFDCVDAACSPSCDGKACGGDGCGGSCGTCADGQTCNASGQCADTGSDCGDVTTEGACDGNTLQYCSGGQLQTFDCLEFSKVCGFDEEFEWFDCLDDPGGCTASCDGKTCGDDGCGGSCGACADGQTCSAAGACEDAGACGGVSTSGECDGNTLQYCSGGEIQTFDCTQFDKVCGFDAQFDWFDCIDDPGGCTADCSGKVCGDDGCGGSCGSCADGQTCDAAGQCTDSGSCGDVTSSGQCDGNTLQYCSNGELQSFDCTEFSKVCAFDDQFEWFDCVDDPGGCTADCSGQACGDDGCGGSCGSCADGQTCDAVGQCAADTGGGCGDVSTQGQCDGNTLVYCSSGELQTFDCTTFDKTCGFDAQFEWFDCIDDPDTCTPSCDGKQCGADGCGSSCGTCSGADTCNASGQCVNETDACGGVDQAGQCLGNTLQYCSNGDIQSFDCTEFSKVCGFDNEFDWFDCLDDPATCSPNCAGKTCGDDGCGGSCGTCADGQTCGGDGQCAGGGGDCGDLTSQGACNGNTLQYCSGGAVQTFDCTQFDKVCGFDAGNEWFDCIDDPNACTPSCSGKQCGGDGCGGSCGTCTGGQTCNATGQCEAQDNCNGIDSTGNCQGNTLQYCSNDALQTFDCTEFDKVCGFDSDNGWFDCIDDPNACTPSCNGKQCGGDGCGGSCGTCSGNQTCNSSGQCIDDNPPQGCGNVTFEGECQGNVLNYCQDDTLQTVDCAEFNGVCVFNAEQGYFDCDYP